MTILYTQVYNDGISDINEIPHFVRNDIISRKYQGKKLRFALELPTGNNFSSANRSFFPTIGNNYVIPNEADEGGVMRNLVLYSKY